MHSQPPPPKTLPQASRTLLALVSPKERQRFAWLVTLAILTAFVELAVAGSVALLTGAFASPDKALGQLPSFLRLSLPQPAATDPRVLILAVTTCTTGLIALKNYLTTLTLWQSTLFSEATATAARSRIFRTFVHAPFIWALQNGTSRVLFLFTSGQFLGQSFVTLMQCTTNGITIVAMLCGLILVSPTFSLALVAMFGVIAVLMLKHLRRRMEERAQAVFDAEIATHNLQQLSVHALKEMRLAGKGGDLCNAYDERLRHFVVTRGQQQLLGRTPINTLEFLGFSTLTLILAFLVFIQDESLARISATMGFMAAAAWRLLPMGSRFLEAWAILKRNTPHLLGIATFLQEKHAVEVTPNRNDTHPQALRHLAFSRELRLSEVSYRFPHSDTDTLRNINFTIPHHSMVGLIGASGSGKTTLVNLISGLLHPTSGHVLIDGTPLEPALAPTWFSKLGYVPQSPHIIDGTLAENVALSKWGEPIDRNRVQWACSVAACDFIDSLEQGMDTVLGERGARLSGGQNQRVAIARAMYEDPELLILDEATSALDIKNEQAIHATVAALKNKFTILIVAHRLSTVQGCDLVVWMEDGAIKGIGTPSEILPQYEATLSSQ